MLSLMDDPKWGPYFEQRDAEARADAIADRNLARNFHVGLGTPDPVQRILVFSPSPELAREERPVAPPPVAKPREHKRGEPRKRVRSLMDLARRAHPVKQTGRPWFGGHAHPGCDA